MPQKLSSIRRSVFLFVGAIVAASAIAGDTASDKTAPLGAAILSIQSITPIEVIGNGDAFVDPGETYKLQIKLENSGAGTAAGVFASISSVNSGVTIVNASSAYVDISGGGTANPTTALTFTTDPAIACGADLTINIEFSHDGGGPITDSNVITLGSFAPGAAQAFISAGVPVSIPDSVAGTPGVVTATITYPPGGDTFLDAAVVLSATHPFDGDLVFQLISPHGTTINLISNRGSSGDNFTNVNLSDTYPNPISTGSAPFSGNFKPEQPFSAFAGERIEGTWTLKVSDTAGGDQGNLTYFSMLLEPNVPLCHPHAAPTAPGLRPVLHIRLSELSTVPVPGTVQYSYRWTSTGPDAPVVHPSASFDDFLLETAGGATFDVGETWTVEVTPYFDGTPGTPSSAKFIITEDGVVFGGWVVN
ncbi:hypothetical protein BH09SUM1_BH09SUM1_19340 [soil metagenome]